MKEILIVDDMSQNRELMREALNGLGYRLFEAEDANHAMRMMQISAVDLVISDVRMPGRSGVELVRKMRSEHPDTAVILITAFSSVGGAVDAMRAGAYDYITRPASPADLGLKVKCDLEVGQREMKIAPARVHRIRNVDLKICWVNLRRCVKFCNELRGLHLPTRPS